MASETHSKLAACKGVQLHDPLCVNRSGLEFGVAVSDIRRTDVSCPRCKARMDEVARIAPLQKAAGWEHTRAPHVDIRRAKYCRLAGAPARTNNRMPLKMRDQSVSSIFAQAFHCFQLASNSAFAASSVATWFEMRRLSGLLGQNRDQN